jgi:2-oxoisovalerate dehydrogenase E1 component
MAPLDPPQDAAPVTASESTVAADAPATLTSADCTPLSLAQGINLALRRILNRQPGALVFGEDVAKKGGVYGITKGLLETFGPARVFNTLLDEQTILGLALGSASLGMLPIPEIQYLAYLHNAEDQLRGEAATLRFFSNCAFDNPMIVRIAGLAYQKGFGGHFHNDNSLAVLRDIPGLIVGVPARADDATAMYQLAEQLTTDQRQVVVFIEPIALYHQRSLTEGPDADTDWLAAPGNSTASLSEVRIYHPEAADLLLVSYGNGVRMSLNARRTLEQRYGIRTRVIDLRWLQPLPLARLAEHVSEVGRALIVDECRAAGSVSEQLVSSLLELAPNARLARVTSLDSFVPLGKAADLVLLSTAQIVEAALKLGR